MSWIRDQRAAAYSAGQPLRPAIMSMSFGGSYSQALNSMTQNLVAMGVHAVVAMGNNAQSSCSDNSKGFSPAAAAGSSPVVAVGSCSDSDALSSFSNTGPGLTLTAPGEDVLGACPRDYANNTYALLSGTSMFKYSSCSERNARIACRCGSHGRICSSSSVSVDSTCISGAKSTCGLLG